MMDQLFRVVFTGELTGEFDEKAARARFRRSFRLDEKQVNRLLSGDEHVIKNNISEADGLRYMIKVLESGYECYVQEMPDENEPEFDEKRAGRERRLRYRRDPRAGAIVPDRRLVMRRRRDRRQYLELKRVRNPMPLAFQSYNDVKLDVD